MVIMPVDLWDIPPSFAISKMLLEYLRENMRIFTWGSKEAVEVIPTASFCTCLFRLRDAGDSYINIRNLIPGGRVCYASMRESVSTLEST